eukprot:1356827-Amphidinium_carterae.4
MPEELDRPLIALLSGASKCSKKKQELVAYLCTMNRPNQRTFVGLMRWSLIQRPWSNEKMMAVATALMDMIMRTDVISHYPEELAMCSDWFDLVLSSIWSKCKKAGMSSSSWLANQRQRASLVLEMDAVEEVLAAKSFKDVSSELNSLCCASRLGNALFGWALVPLVSEKVSECIDRILAKLVEDGGLVTPQKLSEIHGKCNDAVRTEMTCALGAREVAIKYRDIELLVTCSTPWEEILMKSASLLKGVAAEEGKLTPLFVENELLSVARVKSDESSTLKVDGDVIAPWLTARRAAAESMNQDFTAKEIVNTLTKRLPTYIALDATFALEVTLFKALGSAPGEKAMLARMLACLPTQPTVKLDFSAALHAMAPLFEGRLYSYLPVEIQGVLRAARDVVASISENKCPLCLPAVPNGAVSKMLNAVEKCLADEIPTKDGGKRLVTGKSVIERRLKNLKSQDLSKSGPECLNGVAPFAWLLNSTDKATLEELRQSLIKAGNLRVVKASASAPAAAKKKSKGDDLKATLDLFA